MKNPTDLLLEVLVSFLVNTQSQMMDDIVINGVAVEAERVRIKKVTGLQINHHIQLLI